VSPDFKGAGGEGDSSVTFAGKRKNSIGVYCYMNMETTNSMLFRASRFLSDRYAYRAQPGSFSELVAFGLSVFIAVWPIILLASAMAASVR
jgi:hypothetical protein